MSREKLRNMAAVHIMAGARFAPDGASEAVADATPERMMRPEDQARFAAILADALVAELMPEAPEPAPTPAPEPEPRNCETCAHRQPVEEVVAVILASPQQSWCFRRKLFVYSDMSCPDWSSI